MTPAEIASMLHRKEERKKDFAAEVDRRIKELKVIYLESNSLFLLVKAKTFTNYSEILGSNPIPLRKFKTHIFLPQQSIYMRHDFKVILRR